jgi:hypothetical protein
LNPVIPGDDRRPSGSAASAFSSLANVNSPVLAFGGSRDSELISASFGDAPTSDATPAPREKSKSAVSSPVVSELASIVAPRGVGRRSSPRAAPPSSSPPSTLTAARTSSSATTLASTARYLSTSEACPARFSRSYAVANASGSRARSLSVFCACAVATFVTSYGEIILLSIATDAVASPSAPRPSPIPSSVVSLATSARSFSTSSASGAFLPPDDAMARREPRGAREADSVAGRVSRAAAGGRGVAAGPSRGVLRADLARVNE